MSDFMPLPVERAVRKLGHDLSLIARAMMILGDLKALENLMDTANDDIGLLLMDEQLPKRVRMPRNVSGGL